MHIVLVNPEIPQNTGNIARTCAATGSVLHLIRPMAFEVSDRTVKRAGLDYWHLVDVRIHDSWEAFEQANPQARCFFLSTKAPRDYTQASFAADDFLVFGRETAGLPEDLLRERYENCLRIPMVSPARSLNLANSAAIVLYEALRQQGFPGLLGQGELPPART